MGCQHGYFYINNILMGYLVGKCKIYYILIFYRNIFTHILALFRNMLQIY